MELEKQLEFKFYKDEKKREKYQESFSRVYRNVSEWVIAGVIAAGAVSSIIYAPEIKNYLFRFWH